MKFPYPNLTTESVNDLRLYVTPQGNYYPSITTILSHTQPIEKVKALQRWKESLGDDAESISAAIADKGTHVHLMCERFLNGQKPFCDGEFSNDAVASFNGLKLKLSKIQEVWGQEVALFSDTLMLAGRCDCIGVYKNKACIIDFKTSSRIKSKEMIEDYQLQLCAYSIMHNEMFGTDISTGFILMTTANGFPQEFEFDLGSVKGKLLKRITAFYSQLNI